MSGNGTSWFNGFSLHFCLLLLKNPVSITETLITTPVAVFMFSFQVFTIAKGIVGLFCDGHFDRPPLTVFGCSFVKTSIERNFGMSYSAKTYFPVPLKFLDHVRVVVYHCICKAFFVSVKNIGHKFRIHNLI
jgi:hypothetical protein